jgi:5'-deoxynucleotidase YfbR-like HD superfamily hydrolase
MEDQMKPWPVARWHCHHNPKLRMSGDDTFQHGRRCLQLAYDLTGDISDDLRRACLHHDDGECITGDLPYSIKRAHPELRAMIGVLETQALAMFGIAPWTLDDQERKLLKLVDLLDPWLWVIRCQATEEFDRDDWKLHEAEMMALADDLGLRDRVCQIIQDAA